MLRTIALLAVIGGLLGGCSSDDDDATPTTTSSPPTTSVTTTSAPQVTTTTGPKRAEGDTGSGPFSFRSPSSNIWCAIDSEHARCDITDKTWSPPPKPADCDLDWGGAMAVTAQGAVFVCAGDSVQEDAAPALPYGGVVVRGGIRCHSQESGMTCEHLPSSSRFMLSRERYEKT